LTYYIVQTHNESILSKYLYTVGMTLFITVGIYHLLIRPFALTRFLLGMKPKVEKKAEGNEPFQKVEGEKLVSVYN
jgi:glucan biosynthesis protein C